jgi:tRNA dimethylallyltransferase
MKVIVISGPTACGKTQLSIDLATRFGGEIVNFDSLLLYKEITIGTAKPSLKERAIIPHHMLDVRSVTAPMNASEYAHICLPVVTNLLKTGKIVYLVGGSGFYLQALLMGMYDSPTTPPEINKRSNDLYAQEGIAPFLELLKVHDKKSFETYHANDHYRIRRAIEHWWSHSTPLSEVRSKKDQSNQQINCSNIHGWDLLHIHLDLPKDEHQQIIRNRTKKMLENGLVEEVKSLLEAGLSGREKPLQSIGHKETVDYLNGFYKTREEYEERIVVSTRQLAKSQRTWFKRNKEKKIFNPLSEQSAIFEEVNSFLRDAP